MENRTFVIKNDRQQYIKLDDYKNISLTKKKSEALLFESPEKADLTLSELPDVFKLQKWKIKELTPSGKERDIGVEEAYAKTDFEKEDFNTEDFFTNIASLMPQLRDFERNLNNQIARLEMKITDIRHYLRNKNCKLNAVQMQRIGYFLQSVERERYKYKADLLTVQFILQNPSSLQKTDAKNKIKKIYEDNYKYRVLSCEELNEIANGNKKGKPSHIRHL